MKSLEVEEKPISCGGASHARSAEEAIVEKLRL